MVLHVRSTHRFLELPGEKSASLLRRPNLTLSTAEVMESAMVWVQHDPASRLSLRLLLYDAVCLVLLSPAALASLAASTAEGVDGAYIHTAMELQHDPARRLERRQVWQDRSRPGDKISVAVTSRGGRLSVLDKTGLAVSAVVCAEPRDGYGYAPATYGGMIMISGGVSQGQRVAAVWPIAPQGPYWSDLPPLLLARYYACAAVVGGCLFVCGGMSDNVLEARVDQCSLHTQLVAQTTPLPSGRCQASAVVQDGQL